MLTILAAAGLWPVACGAFIGLSGAFALGTPPPPTPSPLPLQELKATAVPQTGAAVRYSGQIRFWIQRKVGSFTPSDRANALAQPVRALVSNPFVALPAVELVSSDDSIDIGAGQEILVTVTDADAAAEDQDRLQLASERQQRIESALQDGKRTHSSRTLLLDLLEAKLATAVTIGYNVRWRQMHELLLAAAQDTPDTLVRPAPFVLQTSLNDYHISYDLNVYTKRPDILPRLYSSLHQNIQDKFNQAGIEIMSPGYAALRDGNTVTIPPADLPPTYAAPAFRVSVEEGWRGETSPPDEVRPPGQESPRCGPAGREPAGQRAALDDSG